MPVLDLPIAFVEDVGIPLSATDLNQLHAAAQMLDGLTFRRTNATQSSGPQTTGDSASWHTRGDYRQSWWALRYQDGMTDLTILGTCDYDLDVYLDGALDSTITAAQPFTHTIDISAGHAVGDIILIEIKTNGNPSGAPAGYTPLYRIDDIYGTPVDVATTWGSVPTFAGTYDAARLNQLRDALQHTWNLVTAIPLIPNVAQIYSPATHKVESIRLFDGAVGRYETDEVLRIGIAVWCQNTEEYLDLYYDGSLAHTFGPYTVNDTDLIYYPLSLTHTLGTRTDIALVARVEDATYQTQPISKSYYTISVIRAEGDSDGYPAQDMPLLWVAETAPDQGTLDDWLNAICEIVDTAHQRIQDLPELWDRARAVRRVYAKDDTQVARNFKRHSSLFVRQGEVLIVRGKGIKVGYGAITVEPPGEGDATNYAKFTWATETSIGSSSIRDQDEQVATHIVMLDTLEGLEYGMRYYVFGTVLEYASEWYGEELV